MAASQEVACRRWTKARGWAEEEPLVAVETPLTVLINGREWITVLYTPDGDAERELVLGLLAGEGLISGPEAITIWQHHPETGELWLRVPGLARERLEGFGRRSLTACCGRGRLGLYQANDEDTLEPLPLDDGVALTPKSCQDALGTLDGWRFEDERTGGLHRAAWQKGSAFLARRDVGRHNALDKIYGYALGAGIDLRGGVLAFSGRLSSEVVLKCAKMGCSVLLSNAAPTTLGLSLAETLGITAVGFVRPGELSVYTHAHRISGAASA